MINTDEAILLSRISDEKQKDGYSLEAQERIGREYCKKNGFSIINSFRMIETGSKAHDRKKFDGMMAFIAEYVLTSTRPLHLIVEKPDRLTRNFTNREQLQLYVMSGKLVVHYYKDRRVLDKNCSPADIFTDDIMTSVSKYIALNIARETTKGMNEKARKGWFPGHAPLGYKNIREGAENKHGRKEAKIVIDESSKKAVLRVFELRALKGYSYHAIRDEILIEELLPKDRAKRFSKSSVEVILNNPFYAGRFFWNGQWHQGHHELFVPMEWIRKVNSQRGTPNTNSFVGPFSYLIDCAVPDCGCRVIYDPKTKVNKTTGESRVYHYYHCADGKRFHKENSIRQKNVSEKQLWESFFQPIEALSLDENMASIIMGHVIEAGKQAKQSADEVKRSARMRLAEMAGKEDELYEHWSGGLLTKDAYARRLERFKEERQEIEEKLQGLENTDDEEIEGKAKSLLELCKRVKSAWNKGCEEERIELTKRVCSNFQLDGVTLRYDLRTPFKKLLEMKKNDDFTKWCPSSEARRTTLRGQCVSCRVARAKV